MDAQFIFQIAILIMSVVIHEVSHGYAASMLGDQTARYEGRLTLNPLKHLDPLGSFLVPVASYLLGGFIIGWAKPVPYNPYNLRPGRWSEAIVAAAGPASNLSIVLVFGLLLRFIVGAGGALASGAFVEVAAIIVFLNIVLALFNLMPIPPLDGSKLLFALLPQDASRVREFIERHSFILVLFFVFFLWQFISPLAVLIFKLVTGFSL